MIRKKIKDLVVGDTLQSGSVVKVAPVITGDKATVVLTMPNGYDRTQDYGKDTLIMVNDDPITPDEVL